MIKNIDIAGMHCAACVQRVENELLKTPGVTSASVNLIANRASVEIDVSVATDDVLTAAIQHAGYSAEAVYEPRERSFSSSAADRQHLAASELRRSLIISAPLTLVIMVLSMGSMAIGRPLIGDADTTNLVLFALTLPVLWSGRSFFRGAWMATIHRAATMDTLVSIGTGAAFLFSAVATLAPSLMHEHDGHVGAYYDTTATIITLILLGRWLEARAKGRTAEALQALLELRAPVAHVLRDGVVTDIHTNDLRINDTIIIRPGERIPSDAIIMEGASTIDESMLTGESMPVSKYQGATITGGTINLTGALTARITAVGADTVLAGIIRAVERAQESKAPIQRLADRISAVFVPIVLVIAAITFVAWYVIGGPEHGLQQALVTAISVLIIACPCALGLATPTAIIVGSGAAARKGILFTTAESLEVLHTAGEVLFDKTGTITVGSPTVQRFTMHSARITEERLRAIVASVESRSEHPLAMALTAFTASNDDLLETRAVTAVAGKGVTATAGGHRVRIGNEALMADAMLLLPENVQRDMETDAASGHTTVLVALDGSITATFGIGDTIRPEASAVMRTLTDRGIHVAMITGDRPAVATKIGAQVGISDISAGVLPTKKAEIVDRHQDRCIVVMVGDGINDAPALAQADVGVAIGTGTDVAKTTADITLVRPDLRLLIEAMAISKATVRTIRQNLFFAFVYNILGIPLAAGLFVFWTGWTLSPMVAAAAMALSSVTVVSNALRLKRIA